MNKQVDIKPGLQIGSFRVIHALPQRLRLKSPVLQRPGFDAVYFQALLEALPGVTGARINVGAASLVIIFDGRAEAWRSIEKYLLHIPREAFNYGLSEHPPHDFSDVMIKIGLIGLAQFSPGWLRAGLSWAICLETLWHGLETLITRGIKVQVLDALAVGLSLLRGNYLTADSIVVMLALSEAMEMKSEQRSAELLRSLLRPQAEHVWLINDGVETKVPLGQVELGNQVVCGAGEAVALDGMVLSGEALVNQSSISGESVPVHIKAGDAVISGSVVEEGRLVVQVERIGSETTVARIGRFIDQSLRKQSKKQTKSAELADKLVPLSLGLSALSGLLTRDLKRMASVLTVDFSCAIKLTSPIAIRSGIYAAGRAGVLLKGASALDAMQDADVMVFDKTGTLTTGQMTVTDVLPFHDLSETQVLTYAAGAEEHYDHPLARAVILTARQRQIELPAASRVDFIVAHGVSANISGQNVLVGSYHFIAEDEGIDCSVSEEQAHILRSQGKTLLYVAKGGQLAGLIALLDEPRPEAGEVLSGLKKLGLRRIVVLTGDHRETALALQRRLPQIDDIYYELKPEDKARIVEELKQAGHQLAYVGDGVNDAPALVNAHVGICMPKGADLAKDAAQVLLLSEDLRKLIYAKQAAERTNQIIRQSFYTTIALNSLTTGLALVGLPPLASALMHNLSTVGILTYAGMSASRSLLKNSA